MLYILWLLFMGVIIGFVAMPIAQRFGYAYGRFGRVGDMIAVIIGSVAGAALLALLFGSIGDVALREIGFAAGALIGAVLAVILLAAFAAKAAEDEPNEREDIA